MKSFNNFLFLIILLILLIPSQFIMLKEQLYPSHDSLYHIGRIEEFHKAFSLGQIPPRLAPTILNSIGYPLFVVNYQLPYYFAEIFMQIFGNPSIAFKSIMSITFMLSAVFAFLVFRNFSSNIASLTGAIVFSYLPYRFANIYQRGSLGESVAIMFVPLVILAIHKVNRCTKFSIVLLTLSIFGLITSHTIIFLIFLPFFILYPICILKFKKRMIARLIIATIWGVLLSSFQLLPLIFEKKYMVFDQNLLGLFDDHFISIPQLLRIPMEGINIGTPIQVGITSILIFFLSTVFLIFKRNSQTAFYSERKNSGINAGGETNFERRSENHSLQAVGIYLFFALISFFFVTRFSIFFWENLTVLAYILYPWRFLSVIVTVVAFLTVILVDNLKLKRLLAVLIIFLSIYTSRHYFLKPTQLEHNPPTATLTTQNEFDNIWVTEETFNTRPVVTDTSNAIISNLVKSPFSISFKTNTKAPTNFTVRKMYFPGWQVKVNGQDYPIEIKDGLISFDLPSGSWQIEMKFSESPLRKTANLITVLSFAVLILLLVKKPKFFSKLNVLRV